MTQDIYPQNLKATATLWLWSLRDFAIACVGLLISVLALTQLGLILPFALTVACAFLSIRLEDHGAGLCALRREVPDFQPAGICLEVRRMDKVDIKRVLGLYFGASMTGEAVEDSSGESEGRDGQAQHGNLYG